MCSGAQYGKYIALFSIYGEQLLQKGVACDKKYILLTQGYDISKITDMTSQREFWKPDNPVTAGREKREYDTNRIGVGEKGNLVIKSQCLAIEGILYNSVIRFILLSWTARGVPATVFVC